MVSLVKSSFHNNLALFCVSRCQQHILGFQKLLPPCKKIQFLHTCSGSHSPEEHQQTARVKKSLCSSLGKQVRHVCGHCKTRHSDLCDDKTFELSAARVDCGLQKISHKSLTSLRGYLDIYKSYDYPQKQSIVGTFFIRSYRGQPRQNTVESIGRAGKGLEFAHNDNVSDEKVESYNLSMPDWSEVREENTAEIYQEDEAYRLQHDPNDEGKYL